MANASPVFRSLLKTALQIIWKYPWLLLFGFLMSFIGVGGFWELLTNVGQTSLSTTRLAMALPAFLQLENIANTFSGLWMALRTSPLSVLTLAITFVIIAVVAAGIFWVAGTSHGTLIDAAHKSTLRLKSTFRAGWAVGCRFSLRIIGIHVGIKLAIFLLFLLGGILIEKTLRINGVLFIIPLLVFIALVGASLIAILLTMYSAAFAVIKGFSLRESFRAALHLFFRHWLISLELSSLFFIISLALGALALFVMLLITIPFIFLFMIASLLSLPGGSGLVVILWLLIAIIVFAGTTALFSAWQVVAWTLLFVRLMHEGATPKLVRLSQKWFG